MVFKWQDDGIVWRHESCVSQGVDDIFKEDVGAHRHAVGDDWLFVFAFPVPAVEFYASVIVR